MRCALLSAVLFLRALLSTPVAAQGASYSFVALFFDVGFFLAFPSWSSAPDAGRHAAESDSFAFDPNRHQHVIWSSHIYRD
jgi:hypothetical protein